MSKGPGVKTMFDGIAGHYDLMNRLMTMGQDQRWRRFVVRMTGMLEGGRVLDLACGTGDIAALLQRSTAAAKVLGADFSAQMLAEARRRFPNRNICWQVCDANQLPYGDGVFQAVTFGYLLRNVDDSLRVLTEVLRVLDDGGRVVCLDTTPPPKNVLYPFVMIYLHVAIPLLGLLVTRDRSAYTYLTGSTMHFHDTEELAALFERAGFEHVGYKTFMFGTIAVHWGCKPNSAG